MGRSPKLVIAGVAAWLLLSATIALTILSFLLVSQNIKLEKRLQAYTEPTIGAKLPPLTGVDLAGHAKSIEYESTRLKTLFLVFAPQCRFCEANWPTWDSVVARHIQNLRIVFVDVSARPDHSFLERHKLPLEALILNPEPREGYRLGMTPQAVLVSTEGKVEHVWTGQLKGSTLQSFNKEFDLMN